MPGKIKTVTKVSLLLVIREAYLFLRNCLGLIFHPFKTLIVIFQEKDISQGVLVLGLPAYLFCAGFVFIKGTRFLIGAPKHPWGMMARSLGVILLLITTLLTFYLFYWFWRIIKLKVQSQKLKVKFKVKNT